MNQALSAQILFFQALSQIKYSLFCAGGVGPAKYLPTLSEG